MENKVKAKQLYFQYFCQHSGMFHDGVFNEYKSWGATPADEKLWHQEYIQSKINALSVNDLNAVFELVAAGATEALPALLEMSEKGDDYAKLRYAESICRIALRGFWMFDKGKVSAIKKALRLWESIIENPVVVDKGRSVPGAYAMTYSMVEEYVLGDAKRQLKTTLKEVGFLKFLFGE